MTACERCGSTDLALELRDPARVAAGETPPREAYGTWRVCQRCGHEQAADHDAPSLDD